MIFKRQIWIQPVKRARSIGSSPENADLIFVFPTEPTKTAKTVIANIGIPIVFTNAIIEGTDLVSSVREPGGNITGVRFPASETTLKRLEYLHEIAPLAKRIYAAYDKNYPGIAFTVDELRKQAANLNITLVEVPATTVDDIKADLDARSVKRDVGFDAVLIMTTLMTAGPDGFDLVYKFADEHKLPVAGSTDFNTDSGAIFNYIPGNEDFGNLAAPIADKILKGMSAGSIPVVSPEAQLRINYKKIQELGLSVSDGLLGQAKDIITIKIIFKYQYY